MEIFVDIAPLDRSFQNCACFHGLLESRQRKNRLGTQSLRGKKIVFRHVMSHPICRTAAFWYMICKRKDGFDRRKGMDLHLHDKVELKKAHPCGSSRWEILRVGMDIKLRCLGCGHELMLPRSKAEKSIRKIVTEEEKQ